MLAADGDRHRHGAPPGAQVDLSQRRSATFQATPIVVNRTMYSLLYALFGFTQGDIVMAFGLAE